jgi:hypothetical protein
MPAPAAESLLLLLLLAIAPLLLLLLLLPGSAAAQLPLNALSRLGRLLLLVLLVLQGCSLLLLRLVLLRSKLTLLLLALPLLDAPANEWAMWQCTGRSVRLCCQRLRHAAATACRCTAGTRLAHKTANCHHTVIGGSEHHAPSPAEPDVRFASLTDACGGCKLVAAGCSS